MEKSTVLIQMKEYIQPEDQFEKANMWRAISDVSEKNHSQNIQLFENFEDSLFDLIE